MSAKPGRTKRRRHTDTPEVIVKESFGILHNRRNRHAYPVLVMVANAAGWRKLASEFRAMARRRPRPDDDLDPDDHMHINFGWWSDNRLSDEVELRLGLLTPENRAAVFRKYGISARSRQRSDLRVRCPKRVRKVKRYMADDGRRRA